MHLPLTPTTRRGRAIAILALLAMARQAFASRWRRPARRAKPTRIPHPRRMGRFVKLFAFLGFLGPGLIAATAGNDVGGVVTYSSDGAQFGYGFLRAMVLITISMAVVQEMCARMGAATGKGLSDLIRERFGVRGAAFALLTLLVANALITVSEFAGIAAVSELFHVSKFLAVPVAALGVWLLVTRGSYGKVEKVFLLMTLAFLAYPIAAIMAHPDWGQVLRQTVVPTVHLSATYLFLLIGTIGTTITPYMQLYIQSSVAEKGVTMKRYAAERADTYFGAIFSDLISAFIIIAMGATVFVASGGVGVQITTAEQAALALAPFVGRFAPIVFGVGLVGAALLAAAVLPLTTAYAITETFGFERGVSGFQPTISCLHLDRDAAICYTPHTHAGSSAGQEENYGGSGLPSSESPDDHCNDPRTSLARGSLHRRRPDESISRLPPAPASTHHRGKCARRWAPWPS
jgi:NRAMP (natural resistance-associated macrophage protein)-like metal ion transporter